ncbi:hypothetical protein BGZ99_001865 [Dissophora globulifera]|uniref:Transcription factor domain-containing protein n=1 Tax=Dissophora globulifera TaxID=979702 RepID=A0A9P6RTR8_9FUNG|nr:hypothetical protein BGZ99_001865 [Dissophora globulifera]
MTRRIALSYPDIGSPTFTGLPPFVPLQGGLNMAPQEYQNLTQASSLQMSLEVTGALTQQQQSIYSQQQQQQQYSENQRPRHTPQHQTDVQQDHSLVSGTTVPSQQQRYRQQISTTQEAQNDPSYTIASATPVSSTGVATQFSSTGAWGNPALRSQVQMEWRDSNATNRQQQLQDDHARFSTPPVTVSAIVPTLQFTSARLADAFPKQSAASAHAPTQSDTARDALRMRKIAKDMLDCKNYDYSIMLPRHISQEHSEFWVPPQSSSHSDLQGIPRRLLMLPKDANFLVDIFFENACFYYPVINRAVVEIHLMEPQTPQALFLLNIVFMTACKHLGRNTDIKRAIQFRERAREIQPYIDGRVRISRMQANLLGSQVIYGVFVVSIGFAEICGTYQGLPTSNNPDDSEPMIDLAAEERSLVADKGRIPEAAYQQRLWTFWGFFSRDAMSRLYFGWPHGIDTMVVNAELPKVKGCVGLGGMRKSPMGQVGVTGKRRGATMDRKQSQSEKRLMRVRAAAMQADRDAYRMKSSSVSDDEDEDEDEEDELDDESDLEQDEFAATVTSPITDKRGLPELDKRPRQLFEVGDLRSHTEPNLQALDIASASSRQQQTKDKAPSFSGLSRRFLEKQGRGEDIGRRQGSQGSVSSQYSADVRRHMDRMKVLLEAESDVTDGASYARVLFLEEIKLWTVGRRVGLYLQGRSTLQTVGSAAAGTGFYSPRDRYSSGDGSDTFGSAVSATIEESRYSESAWLDDKELQGLQAELIAWEQALPPMFKFRQDVEAPDVNHKVNGKMGILMMYYYTITIMLQSSYLPIPQYLSSSPHGSVKSPESLNQEYDAVFSRAISEDSNARVKSETEEYIYTRRSLQPSINGYFNTAHQICTQLSNVLYHHVELMLDSYPNWCPIQSKLNQTLTAALRVSCLNARLNSNSKAIRDEAKAGFKMGSDLFKRQAVLPDPLTVRDWPAEEDVQVMLGLEEEFRELMTTQEEEQAMAAAQDYNEGFGGLYEDPGDHLLYPPEYQDGTTASLRNQGLALDDISQQQQQQYDLFRTEHVFGLSDEGFQFNYNIDA